MNKNNLLSRNAINILFLFFMHNYEYSNCCYDILSTRPTQQYSNNTITIIILSNNQISCKDEQDKDIEETKETKNTKKEEKKYKISLNYQKENFKITIQDNTSNKKYCLTVFYTKKIGFHTNTTQYIITKTKLESDEKITTNIKQKYLSNNGENKITVNID